MKRKIRAALVPEAMSPEVSAYETDESDKDVIGPSDEEEGTRPAASKKKVILTQPLSWTSTKFSETLKSLDRKTMRKKTERARAMVVKRKETNVLVKDPPEKMPAWAVKKKSSASFAKLNCS